MNIKKPNKKFTKNKSLYCSYFNTETMKYQTSLIKAPKIHFQKENNNFKIEYATYLSQFIMLNSLITK